MEVTRRRDTPGELALRSALHHRGLRYAVDRAPILGIRRRADIVFITARVAVFVDGCFWHGCPEHGTWPKTNATWWRAKIHANQRRDADTDERLKEHGWVVVRLWAHEDVVAAARRITKLVKNRRDAGDPRAAD
jgi:DNA mismatch endonuclease (patch repair protein)